MRSNDSVTVERHRVVIRAGNATIAVNFDGDDLVTVNHDKGGPTETIKHKV